VFAAGANKIQKAHSLIPFTDYSKAKGRPIRHRMKCRDISMWCRLDCELTLIASSDEVRAGSRPISCVYSKGLIKSQFPKTKPVLPGVRIADPVPITNVCGVI